MDQAAPNASPQPGTQTDDSTSDSRQRVLDVAERLFMENGYKAVTLRQIADSLQIKQASLYHHVPQGKKALFIEVVERSFARHQSGLRAAITSVPEDDMEAQLKAAASWVLSQTPVDFGRMIHTDMAFLDHEERMRLLNLGYNALLVPLEDVFNAAYRRGDIRMKHPALLSGGVLSLMTAVQLSPVPTPLEDQKDMANELIDVFLNGLLK